MNMSPLKRIVEKIAIEDILIASIFFMMVLFSSHVKAGTTYYFDGSVDGSWDTVGNWWTDAAYTIPAGTIPSNGDDVYVDADVLSSPSVPVVLENLYVATTSNVSISTLANVDVTGDALFGVANMYSASFSGTLQITGTAVFEYATVTADIIGDPIFNNTSNLSTPGSITGNPIFNDSSRSFSSLIGNPIFNDSSYEYLGTITGNAVFNDSSFNAGFVNGNPVFNDTSYNGSILYAATINGNPTFNDDSINNRAINGEPVFNDSASNNGLTTGNATFNDLSYNAKTVDGDATFTYASDGLITLVGNQIWGIVTGVAKDVDGGQLTDFIFNDASVLAGILTGNLTMNNDSGIEVTGVATSNAVFNNFAYNTGLVHGNVSFYDTTYHAGDIDGDACFDSGATNDGTVSGAITICPVFSILTTVLPDGTVGTSYVNSIETENEEGIVSLELVSGTLPPGLSFSGNEIDGIPTTQGVYVFSLRALDNHTSGGFRPSAPQPYTVTIATAPSGTSGSSGGSSGGGSSGGSSGGSIIIAVCSNGVDDDGDGKIDYPADSGCASLLDTSEADSVAACADTIDNDSDGLIDFPTDPGCTSVADADENDAHPPFACSDGIDNDHDGKTDYPWDAGCDSPLDVSEQNVTPPPNACADSRDNDGDGKIDFPNDPGCISAADTDEYNPPVPACNDGKDNDGDGKKDYPADPGCISPSDTNEADPVVSVCSDTLDNDGDGFIDMSDPGCGSPTDSDEYNVPIDPCVADPSSCLPPPDPCVVDPASCVPPPPPETYCDPSLLPTIVCIVQDSIDFTKEVFGTALGNAALLLADPLVDSLSKIIGIVGLVVAAFFTVIPALFATPLSFSELALIPGRLWSLLMSAFGIKKQNRKWGTVYDSVTKQPLDPVAVSLLDVEGKVVAETLTDIDGRYGFLVSPGKYRILPKKVHYSFPSLKLIGKTRDELYLDLYFGYVFEIKKQGEVITKNIPMDPDSFDWNEFKKNEQKLTHFYSKRDIIVTRIVAIAFSVGITVATIAVIVAPSNYNISIFTMYLLLLFLRESGIRQKKSGLVVKKGSEIPIPFAIIRVFSAKTDVEIAHKTTDMIGKYFLLLQNGTYYVTIEAKKVDGTYKKVFTSEPVQVKNGILQAKWEI